MLVDGAAGVIEFWVVEHLHLVLDVWDVAAVVFVVVDAKARTRPGSAIIFNDFVDCVPMPCVESQRLLRLDIGFSSQATTFPIFIFDAFPGRSILRRLDCWRWLDEVNGAHWAGRRTFIQVCFGLAVRILFILVTKVPLNTKLPLDIFNRFSLPCTDHFLLLCLLFLLTLTISGHFIQRC